MKEFTLEQPENAECPIVVTELGISIVVSPVQFSNTLAPIVVKELYSSKFIDVKVPCPLKSVVSYVFTVFPTIKFVTLETFKFLKLSAVIFVIRKVNSSIELTLLNASFVKLSTLSPIVKVFIAQFSNAVLSIVVSLTSFVVGLQSIVSVCNNVLFANAFAPIDLTIPEIFTCLI